MATAVDNLRFFDLTPDELSVLFQGWEWPRFRAGQVLDWVYRKNVADPNLMSNLGKLHRQMLAERVIFSQAKAVRSQQSADGTLKLLLTWPDGKTAETVLIPDEDRRTACVSSQVGCPVGCRFCASGLMGVKGNLSAGQIVEQIYVLNTMLSAQQQHVTNIVFMGMGEPLANYSNVMKAVRILHDARAMDVGARRITISTVGVPPQMRRLADEGLPLNLALSLHAPNDALRRQLIPWAENFGLEDILGAARYYFERTGREITLEYILLAETNDRPAHARELVRLCRSIRANVNLLYYNEVEGVAFKRPEAGDVAVFQEILRDGGVNTHVRKSRGRDIDAACGQLRRRDQELSAAVNGAQP